MSKQLSVDSVRQIYNDDNHNAFTDLCYFQGAYYLTFRNCPGGHMLFTTSRILIMRSPDGVDWEQVHAFNVPERDVRDPHFMVFNDKLFVYSGTWLVDPDDPHNTDMNTHQGYCVWSPDGTDWHGPTALEGTYGYYIWRTGAQGGYAYLNGRRIKDFATPRDRPERDTLVESWLLRSKDGITWTPHGLMQPTYGDETAFLFEEDGSILAVARSGGRRAAQVCRSQPPYTTWTRTELDRYVGGPMLARWGDRYLVGGRKMIGDAEPVTTLYWLVDDQLVEIAELPSGGDNSYPGFVACTPERGLLSYYSSHEGGDAGHAAAAIYLAELSLR